ncbi:hypothetical protein [Gemmiger sp.]|uniref:hypothetical protein n=1 Tax=Gemmiger sp. TaxID=2049027 RepID=UPI003F01C972
MKKLSFVLAAVLLAASLAACGRNAASSGSTSMSGSSSSAAAAENAPSPAPESGAAESGAESGAGQANAPDEALSAIVDQIYAKAPVELMMVTTTAVDLTSEDWLRYNAGLTMADAGKIDNAVLSESMTGSQAYSLVVVRVKDAAEADAVAQTMIQNVDPAKWVCVMADQQQCNVYNDIVVYCMADSNLVDVSAIMNAATEVLGEPTATHTAPAQNQTQNPAQSQTQSQAQ